MAGRATDQMFVKDRLRLMLDHLATAGDRSTGLDNGTRRDQADGPVRSPLTVFKSYFRHHRAPETPPRRMPPNFAR